MDIANFKNLIEYIPDPVIITDKERKIIAHNSVAIGFHNSKDPGYSIIGKRICDFIPFESERNEIRDLLSKGDIKKYNIHFKAQNDEILTFELNVNTVYDADGNFLYRVIIGRDITQLQKLVAEKDLLIKETHHRIKNNLQQIYSLIGLQLESTYYKLNNMHKNDNGSKSVTNCYNILSGIISDIKQRILIISDIHQLFYKENINKINIEILIKTIFNNIYNIYAFNKDIKLDLDTQQPYYMGIDCVLSVGIVLNEIICNSFKYAFDGRKSGIIRIVTSKDEILISDDGVGMKSEPHGLKSMGIMLIYGIIEDQLGGTVNLKYDDTGTQYKLNFSNIKS